MFSSSSIWENHGKFWPVPTLVRFLIHSWILLNDQIAGFIYIPWTTYLIVQYIYHLPNVISPAFNQLSDLAIRKKNCARRRGALLCKAWAEIRPFQDANEDLLTNGRLHLLRWCGREKKHVFAGKNCWDNQDHPIWSNSTWSKCMKNGLGWRNNPFSLLLNLP